MHNSPYVVGRSHKIQHSLQNAAGIRLLGLSDELVDATNWTKKAARCDKPKNRDLDIKTPLGMALPFGAAFWLRCRKRPA